MLSFFSACQLKSVTLRQHLSRDSIFTKKVTKTQKDKAMQNQKTEYIQYESKNSSWITKLESELKSRIKKINNSAIDSSFLQSLKISTIIYEISKDCKNPSDARNIKRLRVQGRVEIDRKYRWITIFPPDINGNSHIIGIEDIIYKQGMLEMILDHAEQEKQYKK